MDKQKESQGAEREEAILLRNKSCKEALAFLLVSRVNTLWWAAVPPASLYPHPVSGPVVQVKSQPHSGWDEKERELTPWPSTNDTASPPRGFWE